MTNKKVETLLTKIEAIKKDLSQLGNMRPGSVTKQFYKRGDKKWPYWQISYTHKKRSKTEYLKDEFVEQIQGEVATYKKFKKLVEKLVELNVDLSKERIKILKKDLKNENLPKVSDD
jgi:hypothetical protein